MTDVVLRESVLTPEGSEVHFGTASASERLIALCLDLLWIALAVVVLGIALGFLLGVGAVLLLVFLLRQGYFVYFETRWNGSTPGKRRFHLRVIRADGGPLTTEILLARNLTREVELFLPMTLLLSPDALFSEHQGLVRIAASLWVLGLMFFPLTNPHRLRIGDLLAGTRVVVSPPVPLLRDLAAHRAAAHGGPREARFVFTKPQLEIYGEHELQVLEDVLRKGRTEGGAETLAAVTRSIARRIGWEDLQAIGKDHGEFLRDFYTAQRQHLEHRLLLGDRRERKRGKATRAAKGAEDRSAPGGAAGREQPPAPPAG